MNLRMKQLLKRGLKKLFVVGLIIVLFLSVGNILKGLPQTDRKDRVEQWKKDLNLNELPKSAIQLKYKFSFPKEEEEPFLRQPSYFCLDNDNDLYISDCRNNTIYKFNLEGKFLKQMGSKGKGPGELLNPLFLSVDKMGNLVVYDTNNLRMQIFDSGGNYNGIFRTFESFSSLIIDEKSLIYCSPFASGKPLIRIFDYNGKSIGSLGEQKDFKKNLPLLNKIHLSMNSKGEIYAAWELFPIVRRYSKDKLLSEYQIKYPKMQRDAYMNYLSIDSSNSKREYKVIIAGMRAKDNGFFIFHFYPRIEIMEFNNEGEKENHYWAEQVYDFIGNDFIVKEIPGGKKVFYILQVFPEPRVDVYSN